MTSTEPRRESVVPTTGHAALPCVNGAVRTSDVSTGPWPTWDATETAASRRGMRHQVTLLSEQLRAALEADWAPEVAAAAAGARIADGPRLLDLGELEEVRDDLVARLAAVREAAASMRDRHARARALLADMYADPDAHRGVRVTTDDLGEPGCCRWQVQPVLGVVGRLAGWWRVKVSSGCP